MLRFMNPSLATTMPRPRRAALTTMEVKEHTLLTEGGGTQNIGQNYYKHDKSETPICQLLNIKSEILPILISFAPVAVVTKFHCVVGLWKF